MFGVGVALRRLMAILQLITSLGLTMESTEVSGYNQNIYTVKAKLGDAVGMSQKLSYDQVYGFETVTEMSAKSEELGGGSHLIGVNGAFYSDSGRPAGMMLIDGEVIKKRSINTPLLVVRYDGMVELVEPELRTYIVHNGKRYETYEVNEGLTNTLLGVFTRWYGSTNRRRYDHTAITVDDGKVVRVVNKDTPVSIPYGDSLNDGDFMVCYRDLRYDFPVAVGEAMSVESESNFDHESVQHAVQTGGWLVRDGKNVAKDFERYIGPTDSLQPRTAVGITGDNRLVIKLVDGRNKGISEGVTGKMMAELLLEDGCVFGAYLDGGASTTLVRNGELINRPSLGEAKLVAHGLFFDRESLKRLAK